MGMCQAVLHSPLLRPGSLMPAGPLPMHMRKCGHGPEPQCDPRCVSAAQPLGSAAFSCPRGQPAPSDALGAPPRAQSSAALGRRHRSWDQRQAALSAHDGGLVGQGRAPGLGFLQRAADATAGSRHTRPRGSQGAHTGPRGGKMRAILRRIQRAYFRRHRRTGSRATQVAVRREHA